MRVGVAVAAVVAAVVLLPGVAQGSTTACEIALAKGTVSAGGSCARTWSYRRYDSAGRPCGAAVRGTGPSFRLPAIGISTVRVTFGAAAKTFALGGTTSCVAPVTPPRSRLCAWTMGAFVPADDCGQLQKYATAGSAGACVWLSPPYLDGTSVSMGRFGCPAADCWVAKPRGPTFSFAGSTLHEAYVRCRDGSWATVGVPWVVYVSGAGRRCAPVRLDTSNLAEYRVPANWGGKLYAVWALVSYAKDSTRIGYESTTAILGLHGEGDGCKELLASGTTLTG